LHPKILICAREEKKTCASRDLNPGLQAISSLPWQESTAISWHQYLNQAGLLARQKQNISQALPQMSQ